MITISAIPQLTPGNSPHARLAGLSALSDGTQKIKWQKGGGKSQRLHNCASKEQTPLYVGKPNLSLAKAGLGHTGHSVPCHCVPLYRTRHVSHPWAKTLKCKCWGWTHTYLRSTARWRESATHMLLLTRAQNVSKMNQVSSFFFHERETRAATRPTYPMSSKSDSKQLFVTLWSLCPTLEIKMNLCIPTKVRDEIYN